MIDYPSYFECSPKQINDFFVLIQYASDAAEDEDFESAENFLKRAYSLARYSSDYIDLAKLLREHEYLQDAFSVSECIKKSKSLAHFSGDWKEIDQFEK